MRTLLCATLFLAIVCLSFARVLPSIAADAGPTLLEKNDVLRGKFIVARSKAGGSNQQEMSGRFVAAPAYGLLWLTEKPIPATTVVKPDSVIQRLGGVSFKLPAQNLVHLYKMVSAALAGNWQALESDFDVKHSGNAQHWQTILVPKSTQKSPVPFTSVAISGGVYVEDIVLARSDGSYALFAFSDEVRSAAPPTSDELAAFQDDTKK